jgi:hypothetical protein
MKPHKWAKEIKAWADGAEIEGQNSYGEWVPVTIPMWYENSKYRIKPQPKEPQYLLAVLLTNGNIKLGIYGELMTLCKGESVDKIIGKIKLEVEDD